MRMSADLRDLFLYEAFLYYNPLLLVVSKVLLLSSWSIHLKLFCLFPFTKKILLDNSADHDGLALGNKFMGLCPGKCWIC